MTATVQKPARGPLPRMSGLEVSTIEEVFNEASLLIVPEDRTHRKAFESLMPYLYALRNKGCSWPQLAKLLNDCGFNYQPATVRCYFGEMIVTRLDICQQRMNEQILLMADIRKETKGTDISSIAGKVSAIMERSRSLAGPKIDAILGLSSQKTPSATLPDPAPRETASPSYGKTTAVHSPAPLKTPPVSEEDSGNFGLLNTSNEKPASLGKPAFFDLHEDPVIPNLKATNQPEKTAPVAKQNAAATPPIVTTKNASVLRCQPLQEGVKQLARRNTIPDEMYQVGDMEHPAVPGLMLSLEQRLYSVALEFLNTDTAEIRSETTEEKRFRIFWQKPIAMTETMTGDAFIKIDESLFRKK